MRTKMGKKEKEKQKEARKRRKKRRRRSLRRRRQLGDCSARRLVSHRSTACSQVLHCTVLHCTVLHCTALYYTVLHCTTLYYTVLYCTSLHSSPYLHIYQNFIYSIPSFQLCTCACIRVHGLLRQVRTDS
jgi:hypothetical protein